MTTYYKGNNIGLSFDGTGWSFNNLAQDFIDTDTFSSQDIDFPYYEPPAEEEEEEREPCPEGYVYDEDLRQCVPDPRSGNPYMPDSEPTQEVIPGTGRELPNVDNRLAPQGSGSIFNYATTAETRARMNEHMLLMEGISHGWLEKAPDGNGYRKVAFNEEQGEGLGYVGTVLKYVNRKSYDDYFEILENGYQPNTDNFWSSFVSKGGTYSLKGGMRYQRPPSSELGPGEYFNYSPEFQEKVNKALELRKNNVNAIIDREGNVNIDADGKGGYYREDGKYVDENGRVSARGSLGNALKLLKNANEIGGLPSKLKARLLKGINTKSLSLAQRNALAVAAGFANIQEAANALNSVQTKIEEQQERDEPDTVTDVSKVGEDVVTSVDGDASDDGGTDPIPSAPPGTYDEATAPYGGSTTDYSGQGSYGGGEDFGGGGISVSDYNNQQAQQAYESAYGSADYRDDKPDDAGGV